MSFDPLVVAAFVDGELDDLTARRIEREAASDPALAAAIERHRALKARLAVHYAPVIEEAVPERLRALLAAPDALDTSLADRRAAKRSRFEAMHWAAIAATLVLGLTIGLRPWQPTAEVVSDQGRLVASGALARALDMQLASNQPADAAIRITLSFRDDDGRFCRSFESRTIDGIGCRNGDRWALETTRRGQERGDYRQATSGELATIAATMMVGEPLDAPAERAARDSGWGRW